MNPEAMARNDRQSGAKVRAVSKRFVDPAVVGRQQIDALDSFAVGCVISQVSRRQIGAERQHEHPIVRGFGNHVLTLASDSNR